MSQLLKISVVSPNGPMLDVDAEEVILPGETGEIGVLPKHLPLLAVLSPGMIQYKVPGGSLMALRIGSGFAEVTAGEHITVVCEDPDVVDSISESN